MNNKVNVLVIILGHKLSSTSDDLSSIDIHKIVSKKCPKNIFKNNFFMKNTKNLSFSSPVSIHDGETNQIQKLFAKFLWYIVHNLGKYGFVITFDDAYNAAKRESPR